MTDTASPRIDLRVNVTPRRGAVESLLPERWSKFVVPYGGAYSHVLPGEFGRTPSRQEGRAWDLEPNEVVEELVDARGTDAIVLTPPGRGLLPDVDFSSAIATAINEWLAATWLSLPEAGRSVFGSIRVEPRDAPSAILEIKRWASHPAMAQVVVPLQAHAAYGQRQYRAVWEAAAAHGLPVMTLLETAAGVDFWRTPVGDPRSFGETATLASTAALYHLVSLVAEGAFEPGLTFVFGDGCGDLVSSYTWRLTKFWRGMRSGVPWVENNPTATILEHARFLTSALEGPSNDFAQAESWLRLTSATDHLMFGSRYPDWDAAHWSEFFPNAPVPVRDRILGTNAMTTYPRLAAVGGAR